MRRGRDGGCEIFSSLGAEAVEGRRVGSRVINCDAFVSSMCIDIIGGGGGGYLRSVRKQLSSTGVSLEGGFEVGNMISSDWETAFLTASVPSSSL